MLVPAAEHDVEWLKESLQAAVELELATIPVYLCGLWSIKTPTPDDANSAYALIRSVVLEEMLHMGLAGNMLATIGGTPEITRPRYPGPLPGGVRPDLTVYLAGLGRPQLKDVYMAIEVPEERAPSDNKPYPSIGAFYDAIKEAFRVLGPSVITGERQLTVRIGMGQLPALRSLEAVDSAITMIKEQGEGTASSPEVPVSGNELAHYFKFGEIYHGRRYIEVGHDPARWEYKGEPVPFPEVWPMARVPAGGYPKMGLERTFDRLYANVLRQVEEAWAAGGTSGQQLLTNAVGTMFELGATAQAIMQIPLPDSSGTYGPDFEEPAPISFESDVEPLFRRYRTNMMWRFDLANYEHVRGNASTIYGRISDPDALMPPPYFPPLTAEQVQLFGQWIDEGCAP
jgi:hypothetical protein